MTSELTSSCSCALYFTAHTHTHTLTNTKLGGIKCVRLLVHPVLVCLFPPLLQSHSMDKGEMLLTVLVCSKLIVPPEVKCQTKGWPKCPDQGECRDGNTMTVLEERVGAKKTVDSGFSHNQSLPSHYLIKVL